MPSPAGPNSPGLLDSEDDGTMVLEMSGTTYPITQGHISEDLNPQQHCC
jgi:hypothetical protein